MSVGTVPAPGNPTIKRLCAKWVDPIGILNNEREGMKLFFPRGLYLMPTSSDGLSG